MRVLVAGSWREGDTSMALTRAQFEAFGTALGGLFQKQGHELLTCSNRKNTADYWMIGGMQAAASRQKAHILFFLSPDGGQFEEGESIDTLRKLANAEVSAPAIGRKGWFGLYIEAARAADVVLILGGSDRGTGGIAYVALALGKPLVAVPLFGGAAARVYAELKDAYSRSDAPTSVLVGIESNSPDTVATNILEFLPLIHRHNPLAPKPVNELLRPQFGAQAFAIAAWVCLLLAAGSAEWAPWAGCFLALTVGYLTKGSSPDPAGNEPAVPFRYALGITFGFILLLLEGGKSMAKGSVPPDLQFVTFSALGYVGGFSTNTLAENLRKKIAAGAQTKS